jgi:hypothetical protein
VSVPALGELELVRVPATEKAPFAAPLSGGRLFGPTQDKISLRLVESRPLGGGVVSMIYAPAMADG